MTDAAAPRATARIGSLRAELRDDSAVVATPAPRLSWTVETSEPDWRQAAAEFRSGDETVRLEGDESVLADWPFLPLAAAETREVRVRVTATSGTQTDWSDPLEIVAGFLAESAWIAEPIGLADAARPAQPALVRTTFTVDGAVHRATLFYTALGVAEPELNGARVDDDVLAPGWTSYRDRLVHETVDVTALVREGENVFGATLAGGWYTEQYGFFQFADRVYGDQPSLLAQLHLEYADGRSQVVATGDGNGWRALGDGPIVDSGIYAGEHADLRRAAAVAGWSTPEFDASAWPAARRGASARPGYEHVPVPEARIAAPVRHVDELPVAAVLISPSGATILDFGQNLVGRLRIRVSGPAGTRLTLRHAEVLEDGELSLRPLRNAAATDVLELAGDDEVVWEPRFTFHGFRYATIEGWPGEFDPAAVTAVVLASDLPRTGWFDSSHELLDRLHENVVWGMRGNFLAIPTDCPQRDERFGWTGDIQVFVPTASFLADCDAFLTSWLRDLALEQRRADGVVPLVVPDALPSLGGGAVAAWGDAAAIVPWVLYERFGDLGALRDAYPSMRDWVDAVLTVTDGAGLWTGAMQLGDWLDPDAPPDKPGKAKVDGDLVASAYLVRSLGIVADTAELLGEASDHERYAALAESTRAAFVAEYVTPAGRIMSDAPTAYALALVFDLVTDAAQRTRLASRLAELVRERGYRIATGFVGTPLIADALAEAGHRYAAERLLLQTECPSWLYPVTMGATTVWERWDSLLPDGSVNPGEMTSFNHYALGAVADWLHRTVAGLAPDAPGYRRIRIAPRPLRGLEHARALHRTPYGPASVAWRREGHQVVVTAEVPPNSEAVVDLPGLEPVVVGSGRHDWRFTESTDAASTDAASRRPLGLDSPSAAIIDDPEAYRAVLDTLAAHDPARAEAVRVDTVWTEGRPLRGALMFTPQNVLADVERALAALD